MHKILSAAVFGIEAYLVEVEVDLNPARDDSRFTTVGLPDAAVKESSDRIRAALRNCGFHFPAQNVTVNLAPADMKKEGSGFDLPIALGVLAGMGEVTGADLKNYMFLGELSLDGLLRPIRGALSIASKARELGIANLVVPAANGREAASVQGVNIFALNSLPEALELLRAPINFQPVQRAAATALDHDAASGLDFRDVRGQNATKRALEVAAAGGHNILMIGPPRLGQDDARKTAGNGAPATELRGGYSDYQGSFRLRPTRSFAWPGSATAVSRATPHHLGRRADRRRYDSPTWRSVAGAQRRVVSR
jgi:magnesium chelatase family protein